VLSRGAGHVEAGGEGACSSDAALALVIKGAATSAIENIASVKSRIANLFMHRSC